LVPLSAPQGAASDLGARIKRIVLVSPPLLETAFPTLTLHRRGKVRDVYEVDDRHLLIVATDRISAFDYVLASGIPDKGKVLTQLSAFWFDLLRDVVPNHIVSTDPAAYPAALAPYAEALRGRSMLVRRTEPVQVECVARGYVSGSGWKDYLATGAICGVPLPAGLRESDRLPETIFTPATKAASGHDENISKQAAGDLVGHELIATLERITLELYRRGAAHAATQGILLADTKFEFGLAAGADGRQEIILIDEVMTPDSSRFWPADEYRPGGAQPSFDKQFVRDYLESIRWNKQPPVPSLPDDVIERTRAKYLDAFRRLTGRELVG
jgi:phosphoribosylaminoimidazole-succinocarboxamide synthase